MGAVAPLPEDAGLPMVGQLLGGKYRVERFIARGGMGAVFVAIHEVTGGRVALKWLRTDVECDAEATHRLIREARAASRVRHPNVVSIYDVGEDAGSLFLVMELLEGETLASLLKRQETLSLAETLEVMLPTMRAVAAAHRSQVIHRDLKPSNVFLCIEDLGEKRTPRVLDFGISKVIATPEDPEFSLTQTGAVMGTPYYMAPEQLHGSEIDLRVDVYSLGVILYQMLSGRLPFYDANYNALVVQIATQDPVPLQKLRPELSREVCAVVEKAMARDRELRYPGVLELMNQLVIAASVVPPRPSRAPTPPPAVATAKPSARIAALAAGLALTAAVSGVAWYLLGTPATEPTPSTAAPAEPSLITAGPHPVRPPGAQGTGTSAVLDPP